MRDQAYHHPDGATVYAEAIDDLVEHGFLEGDRLYRLRGFPTATGKVEFDSQELREAGHDGLPVYREPLESPLSTPALAERYPLVLTSGGRQKFFTHSQQRNVASLLAHDPRPRVQIHPADAAARGISDGDWVMVRSPRGAVRFAAEVSDMIKEGVAHCFHGWNDANVNELTDHSHLDPISGFPSFKALLCEVERLAGTPGG